MGYRRCESGVTGTAVVCRRASNRDWAALLLTPEYLGLQLEGRVNAGSGLSPVAQIHGLCIRMTRVLATTRENC